MVIGLAGSHFCSTEGNTVLATVREGEDEGKAAGVSPGVAFLAGAGAAAAAAALASPLNFSALSFSFSADNANLPNLKFNQNFYRKASGKISFAQLSSGPKS